MKQLLTASEIKQKFPFYKGDLKNPKVLISDETNLENLFARLNKKDREISKEDPLGEFKYGDTIHFISGYNNDILFESKIYAFASEDTNGYVKKGMLFVYTDSYWFPIQRNIVAIKN